MAVDVTEVKLSPSDVTTGGAALATVRAVETGGGYVPVTGISGIPAQIYVSVNETYQLYPVIEPANATDKTLTYSITPANALEVSATGLIRRKAAGNGALAVTAADGVRKTAVVR